MLRKKVLVNAAVLLYILSFFVVQSRTHRSSFRKSAATGDDEEDDLDTNEYTNLSTNEEELEPYRRKTVDPEGSWRTFMRYSDRNTHKPKKNKKRQNRQKTLHGPQGPPGPQGPQGPPGPPGSLVSKDEIIEELKDLIKEAAEKRAQELLLEMPFGAGAFQRGDVFNAKEGRFYAPRDGVYQFNANLHIRVRSKRKPTGNMRRNDNVKVVICIESLCQKYTSLETVTGLESNSKIFTVQTNGMLQLKPKQYVSVYVDNSSALNVVVLAGSEFTGLLLGV